MERNHMGRKGVAIAIIVLFMMSGITTICTTGLDSDEEKQIMSFVHTLNRESRNYPYSHIDVSSMTDDGPSIIFNKKSTMIRGNEVTEEWNSTFSSYGEDRGYYVQITSDGGYILTGEKDNSDLWLIKTNQYGNKEWEKTYGRPDKDDAGYCVQQTSDGGYIVVGYNNNTDNLWLIKTDGYGNFVWNKNITGQPGFYHNEGHAIEITSDGGYIITGETNCFSPLSVMKAWLIKTDSYGNIQWQKVYQGSGRTSGWDIKITSDGGFIIAGATSIDGNVAGDIWIFKTDHNGNMTWNKTFTGTINQDCAYSIQQTIDDGYIVTGYINGGPALTGDLWLIKTDQNGHMQWNRTYGGANDDSGYSVLLCPDGGYYVIGHTYVAHSTAYWPDVWIIKTDENGFRKWQKTFGGSGWDYGYSAQLTSDNDLIITGSTESYGYANTNNIWLLKIHINKHPIYGSSTPSNGSINNPISFPWSIPIYDLEGNTFNWAIKCSNGQTNSGTGDINGTKTLILYYLTYSTTYKIWVNATDPDGSGLYTKKWYTFTTKANDPPDTPSITGPAQGKINVATNYNFTTTDTDGEQVYYYIDWGDGTNSNWIGVYPSGDTIIKSHTWSIKGSYTIRAKAKDTSGAESSWGTLSVTMPYSFNLPFMEFWIKLFGRFPHAFPIIRHLLDFK